MNLVSMATHTETCNARLYNNGGLLHTNVSTERLDLTG